MRLINIEAVNLINVTENMGRRRGDLAGLDLKEQKEQGPWCLMTKGRCRN